MTTPSPGIQLALEEDEALALLEFLTNVEPEAMPKEAKRLLYAVAARLEDATLQEADDEDLDGDVADESADEEEADGGGQVHKTRSQGAVIDISPLVSPRIAVWPGDVPFKSNKSSTFDGGHIDLGDMHTTYHVGAHTDAPRHYKKGLADAANVPLASYYGPCQVIEVRARRGKRFGLSDLAQKVTTPRVLFKTGTFPDPLHWNNDFAAPEPELIDQLAKRGVVLVGFDTPSTDLFDSKGLPSHQRLGAHGMMNLEGLVLNHVEPGDYTLMALPLRLEDADASPVRAVLIRG